MRGKYAENYSIGERENKVGKAKMSTKKSSCGRKSTEIEKECNINKHLLENKPRVHMDR